jgi:photosystem II stability/assembly factor-like uncharacterized protein
MMGTQDELVAVGWLGNIWSSSDGGASWEYQENPTEHSINAIARAQDGTRFAAADKGVVLWAKPDQSWDYAPTPNVKSFLSGVFVDERGVFVVGEAGAVLFSVDLGRTWRTTNAGKSWLRAVVGDAQGLYTVGFQGAFYCSFDEGETWQEAKTGGYNALYGVWADGRGNVYAVGSQGTILKTNDKCKSFQRLTSGVEVTLFAIHGASSGAIYAVGSRGVALRSIDQGQTWEALTKQTEQELYTIAESGGVIYAAGAKRTTIRLAP